MSCSKLATLSINKLSIKFNVIPIKIPVGVIMKLEKLILRFIWRIKGLRIIKIFLKKKEKEGLSLVYVKT